MSDPIDRAAELEQLARDDALREQARRAGLQGKTAADSAAFCEAPRCGEEIPPARRAAVPGCRLCVDCQARLERGYGR